MRALIVIISTLLINIVSAQNKSNPHEYNIDKRNGFKSLKLDTPFVDFDFLSIDEIIRKKNDFVSVIWKSFPLKLSTIFNTEVKSIILLFEKYKLKMIQVVTYSEGNLTDEEIIDHYFMQMENLGYSLGEPTKIDETTGAFMWVGETNVLSTSIQEKKVLINGRETNIVLENYFFLKKDGTEEMLINGF